MFSHSYEVYDMRLRPSFGALLAFPAVASFIFLFYSSYLKSLLIWGPIGLLIVLGLLGPKSRSGDLVFYLTIGAVVTGIFSRLLQMMQIPFVPTILAYTIMPIAVLMIFLDLYLGFEKHLHNPS